MEPNNWDLEAVVRGCSSASDLFSFRCDIDKEVNKEKDELHVNFPELSTGDSAVYELEELCKPFMANSSCSIPISEHYLQLQQQHYQPHQLITHRPQPSRQAQRTLTHTTTRPKKKRNQQKKVVCQVPADGTASDLWAWRKYGQKPIKGSPYPRGYYRCSSSKGCPARKQVERSRANSGTLLITYTAEHNHPVPTHRSSLAGSTRQKLPPPSSGAGSAPRDLSPTTPLTTGETAEEEDEEDDGDEDEELLTVEDMEIVGEDDVLFMELEEEGGSGPAQPTVEGGVDFSK